MAKQVLQRLSFTAGELTPWLAGRADLDPVSRGASRLINFLVSPAVSGAGREHAWSPARDAGRAW